MVKKKGEEIEAEVNDAEAPESEATPTAEQQLEALQAQLKEEQEARSKAESSIQGLKGSLQEKDKKLQEMGNLTSRMDGFEDSIQILAGLVSRGEISSEESQDYKKEFEQLKEKRQKQAKEEALKAQQEEYNQKATAIYERAKGRVANKKDLKLVEMLLSTGDLNGAEEMVSEAEGGEKKVEDNEKATMQARIDKLEKIISGKLDAETGLPSGSGEVLFTREQIRNMSDEEYREKKPLIDKAEAEDKIR